MGLVDSIRNQFDDEPGGGFVERGPVEGSSNIVEQQYRIATGATDLVGGMWSNQDRDRYERDTNGSETFGDGSNRWIPGTIETIQGDGKGDISGVLDAAALNFDEGVGGIVSLFDSEPGNTAGPGQSPFLEGRQEGQPGNPGTTGSPLLDRLFQIALLGGGLWFVVNILPPLLDITAGVIGDE
ncbi:hypothetical protein [Salinigranum sp. GCM10025319]|uniref:hypothetical protein n=1 Tax=Salinigranum sp. GCM10025319 TaxID=3252687 RepID=UPI00361AF886